MASPISRKWLYALVAGVAVGGGLQFVRPTLTNPPITGDLSIPADVKEIFERACYDCHSNQTRLTWFDHLSPAIWLVADDVNHGRAALNFSHWDKLSKGQQQGKLFEALNQATFKAMPPEKYVALHPSARLTDKDLKKLQDYLATQLLPSPASAPAHAASDAHPKDANDNRLAAWNQAAADVAAIPKAPNGIEYIPEYKNWATISVTDRFDTNNTKIITGNDVAVQAVRDHKTNPWPDGSILAKIAYDNTEDAAGFVHTGKFKQVSFMIKDSKKYEKTQGWGYARWTGDDHQQPDKDPFTTECVNCHAPMRDFDYVFSHPIDFSAR